MTLAEGVEQRGSVTHDAAWSLAGGCQHRTTRLPYNFQLIQYMVSLIKDEKYEAGPPTLKVERNNNARRRFGQSTREPRRGE